jgi:hypothetical protein
MALRDPYAAAGEGGALINLALFGMDPRAT